MDAEADDVEGWGVGASSDAVTGGGRVLTKSKGGVAEVSKIMEGGGTKIKS